MILLRFHRALATVVLLACAAPASRAAAVADTSAADSSVVESRPSLARTSAPRVSGFTRPDLFQHASLSFASGLAVGLVTEEPAAAAGAAISLGVFKELIDTRFDRTDLIADLIGAGLAALVIHATAR